jgi:hypothetical protein
VGLYPAKLIPGDRRKNSLVGARGIVGESGHPRLLIEPFRIAQRRQQRVNGLAVDIIEIVFFAQIDRVSPTKVRKVPQKSS